MRVLVSNDDGILAPGIKALAAALEGLVDYQVVAPETNCSGASSALTLGRPIRVTHLEDGSIAVNGTPADCVHLAMTGLLEEQPDLVLSGVNRGPNLSDDVIYSGTLAAAMEGRVLQKPSIAFSLANWHGNHFETAEWVVRSLVKHLLAHPLKIDAILNVNIPDLPQDAVKGFKVTRLGGRAVGAPPQLVTDPRGDAYYWIGPPGDATSTGPGTDFHALDNHYVSVTPIATDLTQYNDLKVTETWLSGL